MRKKKQKIWIWEKTPLWGSLFVLLSFVLGNLISLMLRRDLWFGLVSFFFFFFPSIYFGEGNGNPLQCSCLENPKDGGAWWAAVYGVTLSRTRLKWLAVFIYSFDWALVLESSVFVAACGLSSGGMWTLSGSMRDLVPWPGIKSGAPVLGLQSLSHWTTRT